MRKKLLRVLIPLFMLCCVNSCSLQPVTESRSYELADTPSPLPVTEVSPPPTSSPPEIEYEDQGDGSIRCRDYSRELSFLYPADMTVLENAIADAVVVSSGDMRFVIGRNLTESYAASGLSFADFMMEYMRKTVPADVENLCGTLESQAEPILLNEDIEGRNASAEMLLAVDGIELYIKTILYVSTYADGTVNYIGKTILAPSDNVEAFNALANHVIGMGAARLK